MSEDTIRIRRVEIDALRNENLALKTKIGELQKEFVAKVDEETFMTSIQSTLNRVHDIAVSQERPATYVLSDFNIQLKAVVTQEAGKRIYALPSKPAEIDPNTMSVVNVVFRPIPLARRLPTVTGPRPVESVEGIGTALGGRLREAGVQTVSDLALASPQVVVKVGISKERAAEFIGMAKLMVKADLAGVEGVDEQAAEMLVVAGKIDSKEKLAQANPEELFNILNEAIKKRTVRVPRGYSLTAEAVGRWVNSAKTIVERTKS